MKMSALVRLPIVIALLVPYSLGFGQGIKETIQGNSRPVTLAVKDLPDTFKAVRLTLSGSSDMAGLLSGYSYMGGANPIAGLLQQGELYWTDGSVIQMEGGQYLVAYRLDFGMDKAQKVTRGQEVGEIGMRLSVVRVDSISSMTMEPSMTKEQLLAAVNLSALREMPMAIPGQAAPEVAPSPGTMTPQPASTKTVGINNIKQIALSLVIYTSDYDGVFPYVQGWREAQRVTLPYSKNRDLWRSQNPNGGVILFNRALAGVSEDQIPEPASTILVYDSKPWPGGKYLAAFADGHARFMSESQWQQFSKTLKAKFKRTSKHPIRVQPDYYRNR